MSAGPRLGILGGGQLARMVALAAAPLGIECLVLDPGGEACAAQVSRLIKADWNDQAALAELARTVDAVSFDFENVPVAAADWLAQRVPVYPPPAALAVAQDRWSEKQLFHACGLKTARFRDVDSRAALDAAVAEIGLPAVLKTRRMGYDGKGQFVLRESGDAAMAWGKLGAQAARTGLILEAFVSFEAEVSVLAVRSAKGEFRSWPLVRNWHRDGVLSLSLAPAFEQQALEAAAVAHVRTLAERLDYVGVLALELFVHEGQLIGNEMAPRVHNSGHWTLEGAVTGQFENHVRAVLGLPLGETALRAPAVMFNCIGAMPSMESVLAMPDVHWHDYGKTARPGRKVGHITVCGADRAQLATRARAVATVLGREQDATMLSGL